MSLLDSGAREVIDGAATEDVDDATAETETVYALSEADDDVRPTRRWYGVTAFALVALGLGVLVEEPSLLLASGFGLAFAGYGRLTSPPTVDLDVERSVSDRDPAPGDEVRVTVRLVNDGSSPLVDLRLVDGVPPRLSVTEGAPRRGDALLPGDETTLSYTVRAERGEHPFEPLTVIARDASGATERVTGVEAETTLTCEPTLPASPAHFPLRSQTSQYTGRFPADAGGPGIEFYATREYRTGDPLSRVDWKRTARTGDLTTVEYRVERTVRVVLVVDARAEAYVAPEARAATAVDRSVEAAGDIYAALTAADHEVGVTAISPTTCWLPPGRGTTHRTRTQQFLATNPALSSIRPDEEVRLYRRLRSIRDRLPADAQVVLLTPLVDDPIVDAAIRLDAHGHPTTVVSPDPTATDSAGHQLATVRWRRRVADLRKRGLPVIDWDPDESFQHSLASLYGRWSE